MAGASNVIGSIVIVSLILGAGYYIFVADDGAHSPLRETVELNIRIESPSLASSTEFVLYIDGEEVSSGNIDKNSYEDVEIKLERSKGKKIEIRVNAVSVYPVLGSREWSDSETVTVGISSYDIRLNYLPI